ncbi:MAG: hypothetical protein ACTHJW_23715, partial [Streptosporangiaceae bacterium]
FLCQIALDETSLWRAALTAELAFVSAGYDQPYAPGGTARAVRDAVRPYVGQLLRLWGTADQGFDMALVAVSVAFPTDAAAITKQLRDWFGRSGASLRTALGLALGFHGMADEVVEQIILDEVGQSICWVRRSDRLLVSTPKIPRSRGKVRNPTSTARCLRRSGWPIVCEPGRKNRPGTSPWSVASLSH